MNENKDLYYSVYRKQYKNAIQYLVNNDFARKKQYKVTQYICNNLIFLLQKKIET